MLYTPYNDKVSDERDISKCVLLPYPCRDEIPLSAGGRGREWVSGRREGDAQIRAQSYQEAREVEDDGRDDPSRSVLHLFDQAGDAAEGGFVLQHRGHEPRQLVQEENPAGQRRHSPLMQAVHPQRRHSIQQPARRNAIADGIHGDNWGR